MYDRLYWRCPKCKSIVDFTKQMQEVFSIETLFGYNADFDAEKGLYLHTIECENCNSEWVMSISERFEMEK